MNELKILRKLEDAEIEKNRSPISPNFMITSRINSEIDLFANLDRVCEAIQAWKSMHPFLQSKVIKSGDKEEVKKEYFFALNTESTTNRNLENVQFLRLRDQIDIDDDKLYDLVVEKYVSETIDIEKDHELLWSMLFLELKPRHDGKFAYEVIWSVHHIIADGMSAKANMLILLSLIEKCLKSEPIEPQYFGIFPGKHSLFESEINLSIQKQSTNANTTKYTKAIKPDFMKLVQTESECLSRVISEVEKKWEDVELIDVRSGRSFASLAQLSSFSREKSHIKPKRFEIPEDMFRKVSKM